MPRYHPSDDDYEYEPPSPGQNRFDDIWREQVTTSQFDDIHNRTGYSEREEIQAHLTIWNEYRDPESTRAEDREFWADYIDAMVSGGLSRDEFFEMYNIDERDFDWQAWREAMGY